ncbi:MAG: hypothetical protein AB1603_00835 [Chloroflexota bacterium]
MEWQAVLALAIAAAVILFPAAFVWYMNIGGIYAAIRKARQRRATREHELRKTRTTPTTRKQVRPRAAIGPALAVTIYGAAVGAIAASFGWQAALAVGLALPVLAVPVAFVWYLNVSGLYQVIRATRERQKRRAAAVREAMEIIRATAAKGAEGQPAGVAATKTEKGY